MLSISQESSAQWRTLRSQRPSMRPATSAAAPSVNGTAVLTSPASMNGGVNQHRAVDEQRVEADAVLGRDGADLER